MKHFLICFCFLMMNSYATHAKNSDCFLNKKAIDAARQKTFVNDTLYFLKWVNFKPVFYSSCIENINLTDVETNVSYLYWASNRINVSSNYQINANSNIRMKAGKMIVLKPNTKIVRGSHYLAKIEACENSCNVEIPKGISPNGDNLNDAFDLSALCSIENCKIFNRYGIMVFEKNNYTSQWHGQDNKNQELPDATYYFCLKFANGEVKTGWVYLNR